MEKFELSIEDQNKFLKKDIVSATGDLEVFGEPTDVLQQIAKENKVSFKRIQKLYYELLEG